MQEGKPKINWIDRNGNVWGHRAEAANARLEERKDRCFKLAFYPALGFFRVNDFTGCVRIDDRPDHIQRACWYCHHPDALKHPFTDGSEVQEVLRNDCKCHGEDEELRLEQAGTATIGFECSWDEMAYILVQWGINEMASD